MTPHHGIMDAMPAVPADPPPTSYARPATRRGYVKAMETIAAERQPDTPVRVYVSVAPRIAERDNWPERLAALERCLPRGIELLTFADVFTDGDHYRDGWQEFAQSLDGLVLIAPQKKSNGRGQPGRSVGGRVYRLGPAARDELRTVVAAGKPVLLFARRYGLVPVQDCRANRVIVGGRPQTKLTVPAGWDRMEPTLQAALKALRPAREQKSAEADDEQPAPGPGTAHLLHPFTPGTSAPMRTSA